MAETIKIQKIKVAGTSIYPATILDAVKDARATIKVGESEVVNTNKGKTLSEIIDNLTAAVSGVASDAVVAGHTEAINKLNSDASTEGSVANTVATEIAKVVASAPEDFDTLKEIADWITNDTTGAAAILAQAAANTSAIGVQGSAEVPAVLYTAEEAAAVNAEHENDEDWVPVAEGDVKVAAVPAVEATGLYKEVAEAKAAAAAVVCSVSVADTTDTTEYEDVF